MKQFDSLFDMEDVSELDDLYAGDFQTYTRGRWSVREDDVASFWDEGDPLDDLCPED